MEPLPEDLSGMSLADAKQYIFHCMSALKLSEKKLEAYGGEIAVWEKRRDLARVQGEADLLAGAQAQLDRLTAGRDTLRAETEELSRQIETMRRRLPGVAARERRIDPDLLEQELLITLGRMPGEGEGPAGEGAALPGDDAFKDAEAGAALAALKAKMGLSPEGEVPGAEPDGKAPGGGA